MTHYEQREYRFMRNRAWVWLEYAFVRSICMSFSLSANGIELKVHETDCVFFNWKCRLGFLGRVSLAGWITELLNWERGRGRGYWYP